MERSPNTPERKPLLIAHRAGNDLDRLEAVRHLRPDLVEADIHYFRGRLEVRHMKTLGPIPFLWDRNPWQIGNPFAPRLSLAELLQALGPDLEPMLDLKGIGRGIVKPVIAAVERYLPNRQVTISSRNWRVLPEFAERPWARVIYSAGNQGQIRAVQRRLDAAAGVAINHTLLSPELVARLRGHVPLVMTWTVDDPELWRRLASWGVNGAITDTPETLSPSFEA
jgi:glycerophosphoryl diester phosphodiesterase